jgi:hypothetical protein
MDVISSKIYIASLLGRAQTKKNNIKFYNINSYGKKIIFTLKLFSQTE